MIQINAEVQKIINDLPCYVATASKNGVPNVSIKGSVRFLDDHTLVFAAVYSQKTLANLSENKNIAISIAVPEKKVNYQFKGIAELIDTGPLFDQVLEGLKKSKPDMKISKVVKINLTEAYGV